MIYLMIILDYATGLRRTIFVTDLQRNFGFLATPFSIDPNCI